MPSQFARLFSNAISHTQYKLNTAAELACSVDEQCFQLLEEVCALGRDKSYVCQKTSGKMDQQQSVFSSQSNNNSASSDDDDEDDDVASTHSGTTLKQSTPSFADSQYVMLFCHVACDIFGYVYIPVLSPN